MKTPAPQSKFQHIKQISSLYQARSNGLHIGATIFEHRRCECERRRREALLGGSGGMPPPENF